MAAESAWTRWAARLHGSGIGARLARGTLWSMASAVATRGLGLVGAMLAARLLGVEAFGQVGVVQQTVATMGTLAGLGVGATASRFIAASRGSGSDEAGRVLGATAAWSWGAGLVAGAVLLGAAPWLAVHALAAPDLATPLRMAVPLLVFSLVAQAQAGALAGFEAFRASAMSGLVGGVAGVPLQLLGAWQAGVPGFVLGLAAAEALRWAFGARALSGEMGRHGLRWTRPHTADLRRLLGFGVPTMLAGVLVGPVQLACLAIVGHQPAGYGEVGLYQATQQFRNLLIFVAVQSAAAVVPVLAAAHGAGDRAGLARGLRRAALWSTGASLALGLPLALLSPWAMGGFGAAFAGHASLLVWLALLAPVQALNSVGSSALSAVDRPWALLSATALFAVGALAIVAVRPDALGLLLSQGLASVPACALMAWALRREVRG